MHRIDSDHIHIPHTHTHTQFLSITPSGYTSLPRLPTSCEVDHWVQFVLLMQAWVWTIAGAWLT